MRLNSPLILVLILGLVSAPAVAWEDVGEGVCAALCNSSDWSTGNSTNTSNGRRWIDQEALEQREERKHQWTEYRAKKAAQTAAQKEFRSQMKDLRNDTRAVLSSRASTLTLMPKAKPFEVNVGNVLGIVANPNTEDTVNSGVMLARPVSIEPNGVTTRFSAEGLRKFSAILDRFKSKQGGLSTSVADEELYYLLNEGAAHMIGTPSRISVNLSLLSEQGKEESRRTTEFFRGTWGMVVQEQREIRKSEDKRFHWADSVVREEGNIFKLEDNISKAAGENKEHLQTKMEEKIEEVQVLKAQSAVAKTDEVKRTTVIATEVKQIKYTLGKITIQ